MFSPSRGSAKGVQVQRVQSRSHSKVVCERSAFSKGPRAAPILRHINCSFGPVEFRKSNNSQENRLPREDHYKLRIRCTNATTMQEEQGHQQRIEESIDPDNVVAKLVAELNQMTFQEREKVCEELHGVEKITVETKELLATSLQEMEQALQGVPNRSIYEKAKRINADYVEDRSFRLMFLRSEYYNSERAALRLVKFLQNKVELFGEETLTRPIYLSDLSDDDVAFMKSGVVQLIQERDRSGRVILGDFNMDPSLEQPKDISNYVRTAFFDLYHDNVMCSLVVVMMMALSRWSIVE